MVYVNKLDAEGLKRLGISFKSDAEMKRFTKILQADLELRVGEAISLTLSKNQIKDFEQTPDSEHLAWLRENCPQHKEITEKVCRRVKEELVKYRFSIPGNIGILSWEIEALDELDLLPMRYYKQLKRQGIDTIGELYSIDDGELAHILGIWSPTEKEGCIKEIREIMNSFIEDYINRHCEDEYYDDEVEYTEET